MSLQGFPASPQPRRTFGRRLHDAGMIVVIGLLILLRMVPWFVMFTAALRGNLPVTVAAGVTAIAMIMVDRD